MRFRLGRRWAALVVAMALGAGAGSALGFLTAPAGDATTAVVPQAVAPSTTTRPESRFAGVSSTTTRPRLRQPTAALRPADTSTSSTLSPATTTSSAPPTSTTLATTTSGSTTTTGGGTTTSTRAGSSSSGSSTSTT